MGVLLRAGWRRVAELIAVVAETGDRPARVGKGDAGVKVGGVRHGLTYTTFALPSASAM
jgi:hypothetical protein